ncbi:MAG: hypothetical protein R6W73_00010 [Candidatus Saliniplasma sp.]
MKIKKYVMAMIVVAALLLAPALASAQYSDEITDSTDDVDYWYYSESGYGWDNNVERPDIDIVRASIEESGGEIHVELEVKGTIQEDEELWYYIGLRDENDESYDLYSGYYYTDTSGVVYLNYPTGAETLDASGFGTSTLQTSFSLELVGNPESLEIDSVETYDWKDSVDSGEYYIDEAEPGTDDSNGDGSNGDSSDGEIDFDEGVIDDIIARGMLCLALAIILPIIIIIVIIVIIVKVLKSGDKGGEQPPQQQYQQPPPPSGPSQSQQQSQGGQGQSETPPPPPPEDVKKE